MGTQTHRHHCAPSPGSYHYPSLHPLFGIGRPDRSRLITLSHSRPAYLSLSHPPLISYFLCLSLFHTVSPLSLFQPPHTTLSCLQIVSVSKLLKSSAYLILLCFLALLSEVSLHLLSTKSHYLALTYLLLTPL